MRKFLLCIPLVLMIVFELIVGINLFQDPVSFTENMIVVFGVFMIVLAVLGIFRWMRARSRSKIVSKLTLAGAVIDLLIGIICLTASESVIKIFPFMVMVYGIVMIIMGFYKIRNYIALRSVGIPRSFLALVGGVLTIVLGVIVFLHPFTTTEVIWQSTGIMLIASAVVDFITLIFGMVLA